MTHSREQKTPKLGEIAEFLSGGTPSRKTPEYFQGTIPWITGNDVVGFRTSKGRECITEEAIRNSATHLVPKGSVLFVTRTGVGKVSIAEADICISQDLTGVVPKDVVDAEYLARYLLSISGRLKDQQRGTTILGITREVVEGIEVPLPPLPIQKQIAAILEKADAAREKRRQANQLTGQFLQSAFLEMFGDPVTNPKGWEKKPLVELCENDGDLRCGPFGSQVKIKDYQAEGVPVWDIEDVKAEFKSRPRYYVSPKKAEELSNYYLQAGDILMTRRATIGISAVYPTSAGRGIMHSALLRIRVNQNKVDSIFLSNQLSKSKDVEDQISRFSSGAIFQSINVSKLKAVHVLIPPLVEQRKFAALVEKVEVLRVKQRESEQELENLFQSLMQRAFKGEFVS